MLWWFNSSILSFHVFLQDKAGEKLADILDNDDRESDSPQSEGSLHNKVEEVNINFALFFCSEFLLM